MPPPQLATQTPRTDIPHPVQVHISPPLWHKTHPSVLDALYRRLCHPLHVHEPLQGRKRLYDRATPVAGSHGVNILNGSFQAARGIELLHHSLTSLIHAHSLELARLLIHTTIKPHHGPHLQPVTPADIPVIGIVPGRDFQSPCPKLRVHMFVGNDRHFASYKGNHHLGPHIPTKALIPGIHCHRRISQNSLRTRGGYSEMGIASNQRIVHIVERVRGIRVLNFKIRQSRLAARAPIDQVVVPEDIPLLIQIYEDLNNSFMVAVIHGKPLIIVVTGAPEPGQLADDGGAILLPPHPHALFKSIAANLLTGEPLLNQLPFHFVLRSDTGVIRAHYPESVLSSHLMVANKQVLDSAIESVPHMEGSCDVRRRNDHGVGVTSSVKSCLKCRPIEPPLHNALLSSARGISSPHPDLCHSASC